MEHSPPLRLAEAIFEELVGIPAADRPSLLADRCAGDRGLYALVEQLLANDDDGMGEFLGRQVLTPERLTAAPPARIGNYEILREIGRGGSGVVYEARQDNPARSVALKLLAAAFVTPDMLRRFRHEAEILGSLQHPGIAQVYEAGTVEITGPLGIAAPVPYFAMELVRGEPVTRYCDRKELSIPRRLGLFRDICNAVQHAHQKGVIHRDLKPTNVLVADADGRPEAKVIDFGVARVTEAGSSATPLLTERLQLIGTPEYMSPEQAELSRDIDTRSDVYSLGVLLYELLTGTTPIEGDRLRSATLSEIQRLIVFEDRPRPSLRAASATDDDAARARSCDRPHLVRTLRGDLDCIVMTCLERDRGRRYATVIALADDIARYLDQQPVLASPPGAGYKLRKFAARNRRLVLAGAALVVSLTLGIVGTTVGLVWAVRERGIAQQEQQAAQAAATLAMQEAERADREAGQAQAINDFMREVLSSADPDARAADIRLIDALSRASDSVPQRFAGHPLLQAQVRDLLGHVYDKLSLCTDARDEFAISSGLWAEHVGADDPRSLSSEMAYIGECINLQMVGVAERRLPDLIERMERVLGPDHPETLGARRSTAITLMFRNRLDEAEVILLEIRNHPAVADDDAIQARTLHSLVSVARRRAATADRPESTAILLAAIPLAQEKLERVIRLHGADTGSALEAEASLADLLTKVGRPQEAVEICRRIMAIDGLGECYQARLRAFDTLADALTLLGESQEPADLQLRELACVRAALPGHHVTLLSSLSEILRYLDRAGRAAEGEALARELAESVTRIGAGHADLGFRTDTYIAHFVSMQDRLDEAGLLFQALLEAEPQQAAHDLRARLHLFYGDHLMRLQQYDAAERELETAVRWSDGIEFGTDPTHPDDIILGFIRLYDAWGNPAKVEEYARLRDEVLTPASPTDH